MKKLIDELYGITARESILRAELRELKSRRDAIEEEIEQEMIDNGMDEAEGTNCRLEIRDSKTFDSGLAESTFPYQLFPELWSIKATALKGRVSQGEYESFRRPNGDVYLKMLS